MKTVKIILLVLMVAAISAGGSFVSRAGDAPENPGEEKATLKINTGPGISVCTKTEKVPAKPQAEKAVQKESQSEKKATLKVKTGSGDQIGIDLTNSVPVRGVQFTVSGVKMTEVRTTSRTAGFLAKFNDETGVVIIVSTAADEIAPGEGLIAEIIGKKVPGSDISLSGVKLADTNRQLL